MGTDQMFPKFSTGDPPEKLLEHGLLNNAFGEISRLSQSARGIGHRQNSNGNVIPPLLPGAEIKLARVVEFQNPTGSGSFSSIAGEVNVVKVEVYDAVFEEAVGTQDLTAIEANKHIKYAAATPDFTAEEDDFVWIMKWSHQWWVMPAGGGAAGGGAEYIIFTVNDVICDYGPRRLLVTPTKVAEPCSSPSELDNNGQVEVYDLKGCILNHYTDSELIGLIGDAMYVGDLSTASACESQWSLLSLCYTGECG